MVALHAAPKCLNRTAAGPELGHFLEPDDLRTFQLRNFITRVHANDVASEVQPAIAALQQVWPVTKHL